MVVDVESNVFVKRASYLMGNSAKEKGHYEINSSENDGQRGFEEKCIDLSPIRPEIYKRRSNCFGSCGNLGL